MHWIALQPLPPDAADLSDELVALGWWALQFTPKVARVQDMLAIEVSASERLFGGRTQLLGRLFESKPPLALVKYRRGATSLIAIARLQAALSQGMPATAPRMAVDDLPLHTLATALPHLGTLARIGCNTWGDLRALPRGGVARRFGAELLDALDRAYGLKPELYPWLTLPEVFEAKLELQAQVDNAPALMFGAQRLLKQLQLWLQLRQEGALALELGWTMDVRRNTATHGTLVMRTAEPTQDITHLQRLLGENLAKITLPAPALYLSLRTLNTEKMAGKSASLLLEDIQKGDSLHQMLERVGARLGADNVLQLQTRADHRPERMQTWQPVFDKSKLIASNLLNPRASGTKDEKNAIKPRPSDPTTLHTTPQGNALYPTWLLVKPMALLVQHNTPFYLGPLTLLAGPQRIEAGWWGEAMGDGDCVLRDYFIARSEQAGLLWIYRERLGGGDASKALDAPWYLHGVFG